LFVEITLCGFYPLVTLVHCLVNAQQKTLIVLLLPAFPCCPFQAEGFAFFRTIQPLVARADNKTAKDIHDIFYPGTPITPGTYNKVKSHLERLYPELGVTKEEIGTFGAVQPLNATCAQKSAAEGVVLQGMSSSWVVLAIAAVFALFGMLQ
jgi:hypothetical protein